MEENKTNDEIINPISEYVMTDGIFVYYSPAIFGTVLIIILYLQLVEQSGNQWINFSARSMMARIVDNDSV